LGAGLQPVESHPGVGLAEWVPIAECSTPPVISWCQEAVDMFGVAELLQSPVPQLLSVRVRFFPVRPPPAAGAGAGVTHPPTAPPHCTPFAAAAGVAAAGRVSPPLVVVAGCVAGVVASVPSLEVGLVVAAWETGRADPPLLVVVVAA